MANIAALVAAGCFADDTVVEVGELYFDRGQPDIRVPASGRVAEPFDVRVITQGDGCVEVESTETEATVDGLRIIPYDRRRLGTCTLILNLFEHHATVRFPSPGERTIVVRGRRGMDLVEHSYSVTID